MPAPELGKEQWQKLKEVIGPALELPGHERQPFLERVLADDASLRASAIEMLQYYDRATAQFGSPDGSSGSRPLPLDRQRLRVEIGSTIGNYRVLQRLGEGGMGVVYLASDERLGRRVALKFLSQAIHGPLANAKAQLLAESRSAALLNHPAIVTLHDVFESDGELVTVMEYVEGQSLSEVIAGQPQPIGFALRLMVQLADALAYAHGRGIVHCDLKPANIHVLPNGSPKILDFGLARALASAEREAGEEHELYGTPGYLAPERLLGRPPTAATDVYALGVIFYQLLTGVTPFRADDEGQLFLDTVTAAPLPPSTLVVGIPSALNDVVLRCLAKSSRDRLQPHELARAINAVLIELETSPVSHLPAGRIGDRPVSDVAMVATNPGVGRHASRVAMGIGVVVALLTLFGFITTVSYSQPLGQVGEFASDSPLVWPWWGLRSLIAVIGWNAILAFGVVVVTGAWHVAAAAIPPFRRWVQGPWASASGPLAPLAATPTRLLASALLLCQLLVILWTSWRFTPILTGLDSYLTRTHQSLAILSPAYRDEHRFLGTSIATEVFVFGLGWYWLLRRGHGGAYTAAGILTTVLSLIVFQIVPFRILYHSTAERVVYRSQPCSLVSERRDDALLFCPSGNPPWSQIVKSGDPELHRQGTLESIFAKVK